MRIYIIMFHIALIIWICLTFVQGNNFDHWLQVGMIFLNCIFIAFHLDNMIKEFEK